MEVSIFVAPHCGGGELDYLVQGSEITLGGTRYGHWVVLEGARVI